MKILSLVLTAVLLASCASTSESKKNSGKAPQDAEASSKDKKINIEIEDIVLDNGEATLPIKAKCIEGYASVVIQIGDNYKTFKCEKSPVNYNYKFPISELKASRDKKKDHVIRIRSFHAESKDKTLSQLLTIVSYKDYQTKLVIHQNVLTIDRMDGLFSDLSAHGQCVENSNVEIEVYDDWRGVSLEEETIPCSESGFAFFSRKPGAVKKGMRLLIRQMKGDKAVASYEVVLFN